MGRTHYEGEKMGKLIVLGVLVMLLVPIVASGATIGGGDIFFHPEGAGDVLYSHDIHVGKLGLKCKECHYQVFHTVATHVKKTMADMEKGESCGTCHNGKRAFDVKGKNCNRCHQQ
jgi:c(7)-type cytochrome triheme protein